MGSGIYFPTSAIPFCLLLFILCFFKKTIKSNETKIYKYLVVINLVGLILELLCTYASIISSTNPILSAIILKSYLVYNIVWTCVLTIYVYYVSTDNKNKIKPTKTKNILILSMIIGSLVTYILKYKLIISDDFSVRYTTGSSVTFTYSLCGIYIMVMLILILSNINNLKNRKYIPIYSFLVTIIIGIIIQTNFPGVLIMTYIETLTIGIMYFTIENPDIKMLDEYNKNKRLAEVNIEDKTNMLFKISQDVKEPITNINEISSKMDNNNTIKDMKIDAKHINIISKDILGQINNIFDITAMDISKIKMVTTKYNIYNLFNQLVYLTKNNLKKEIDFKYSIATNTPDMLYGDSLKLKQIIYSCIANSIKNTKEGFIDLDISSIEKYDVCRLIIKVSDSGKGMELTKINEILEDNIVTKEELNDIDSLELSLKVVKKIINIQGGTLLITSEADEGTTITIIIDQKISNEKEKNIISDKLTNKEKVLVIDNNYKELELLKRELQRNNYIVTTTMYGKDLIDKINNGYKYSLIFIDDEMKECNAVDILSKLNNKDLKIIIMLDKDKESIKDKYLEDYNLLDYLLKSNYKQEIKRIISKYL